MEPREIKQSAAATLAGAGYDPKKLALLHTGVVVLFSLITSVLSYLLEMGMDNTGGLAGIGLRSVLQSAQVVLSLAGTILLPLWQIGFLFAALGYSKNQPVGPSSLLAGFRRFGPVLRLNLLLLLVAMGVVLASSYIATAIFMFSPFSDGLYAQLETILVHADTTVITDEMLMQLMPHMGWMFALECVVLVLIGLPIFYRYRMSQFSLMNGAKGALAAMRESAHISWHRRMAMFRFDLSFWWYYGVQLLTLVIAYADLLLSVFGINLPFPENGLFWSLFALHAVVTLVFIRQYGAYYQTAYAHYYLQLRENVLPTPGKPDR